MLTNVSHSSPHDVRICGLDLIASDINYELAELKEPVMIPVNYGGRYGDQWYKGYSPADPEMTITIKLKGPSVYLLEKQLQKAFV